MEMRQSLYEQALQFRQVFEFSNQFSKDGFSLQKKLISEEIEEVCDAAVTFVASGEEDKPAKAELLKELGDLVFVCYQMAAYLGMDLDEAMDRIFKSNMSKVGPDGKPIWREDGKVLKGPNYAPPNLADLV
jgi:predicted HAD superfamily Cof-like phosphohydrolase